MDHRLFTPVRKPFSLNRVAFIVEWHRYFIDNIYLIYGYLFIVSLLYNNNNDCVGLYSAALFKRKSNRLYNYSRLLMYVRSSIDTYGSSYPYIKVQLYGGLEDYNGIVIVIAT